MTNEFFGDFNPTLLLYSLFVIVSIITGIVLMISLAKNNDNLFYTEPNKTLIPEKKMWLYALLNVGVWAIIAFFGNEVITLMLRK